MSASTAYDYWKNAMAGKKPKMFVDQCELGFYRKSITERDAKGNNKRVGWTPVAVFMDGDNMVARVGHAEHGEDVTGDKLGTLWSWIASNAITEETWRAVAERGEPWPDDHKSRKPAAEAAPAEAAPSEPQAPDETPDAKIAREIAEQKAYLPEFATIESDEQSARARSLQTTFLDLRGQSTKEYEVLNRPLLDQQKQLRETWFPLRDDADTHAKALAKAMGAFEDVKRIAAKRAQDEADKIAREHAEATRKAEAANAPPPPPPVAPTPNVPPPSSQIRGGTGRAASVKVETIVLSIEVEKVFEQFKSNPELTALLHKLAQAAIKAGISVPGAFTEQRSIVR